MTVFIDTSAFYALASSSDEFHEKAKEHYRHLLEENVTLFTSSTVLIETMALIHRRLGFDLVNDFMKATRRIIRIVWITEEILENAWHLMAKREDEHISIVDWTSFVIMREMKIDRAFAFDDHFRRQGFNIETAH